MNQDHGGGFFNPLPQSQSKGGDLVVAICSKKNPSIFASGSFFPGQTTAVEDLIWLRICGEGNELNPPPHSNVSICKGPDQAHIHWTKKSIIIDTSLSVYKFVYIIHKLVNKFVCDHLHKFVYI